MDSMFNSETELSMLYKLPLGVIGAMFRAGLCGAGRRAARPLGRAGAADARGVRPRSRRDSLWTKADTSASRPCPTGPA